MTRHPNGAKKSTGNAFNIAQSPVKHSKSTAHTGGKPLPIFGKALVLDCAGRRTVPLNASVRTTSISEAA